ncbi:MAG: hypothetical protein V8R40_13655 [Dysosmobacter sp.]
MAIFFGAISSEAPELEVFFPPGQIVNEAQTFPEEQAKTAAETFNRNARFAEKLPPRSLHVFLEGRQSKILAPSTAHRLTRSPYTLELQCEVYQKQFAWSAFPGRITPIPAVPLPNTPALSCKFLHLREGNFFTPPPPPAASDEFLKAVEQELNVQASFDIAAHADLPPARVLFGGKNGSPPRSLMRFPFYEIKIIIKLSPYELACHAAWDTPISPAVSIRSPALSQRAWEKRVLGISKALPHKLPRHGPRGLCLFV